MKRKANRIRSKLVNFYVTEEEKEKIIEKARYCNLDISGYLRKISLEGVIIKRDYSWMNDVNKIGVNINQIAKKVNQQNGILEKDFEELQSEVEKLSSLLYLEILK